MSGEYLDDSDLAEMHVAVTYSHHAGFTRVQIDPLHVLMLIEEVQASRRARNEKGEHNP